MTLNGSATTALQTRPIFHLLYSLWLTSPGLAIGLGVGWAFSPWLGLALYIGFGALLLLTHKGELLRFGLAAYTFASIGFTYARVGITPEGTVAALHLTTFDPATTIVQDFEKETAA